MQETITYAIVMVMISFRLTSITDKRIKVGIKETDQTMLTSITDQRIKVGIIETNNSVNFDHGLTY